MAATVAASKTYDVSGGALREDLENTIWDISPMDTWFLNGIERTKVKSTTHEWLTDTLTAATAVGSVEGDAFAASARVLPSRLKNYTQINRVEFEVTGTTQAVDNAGMAELLGYHTARAGKELKRNVEKALLGAYTPTVATSTSVRVSAGTENWTYTDNHIKIGSSQATATTVAPASGVAGAVTAGTSAALTSTELVNGLTQAWSCGGTVDTLCVGPTLYNTISGFTSIATRFRDVASKAQAQIIGAADVYVSLVGSHNLKLSRYCQAATLQGFDMSSWAIGILRPFQTINISKIGDAERRMLLVEWTLICRTPKANFKVTSTS